MKKEVEKFVKLLNNLTIVSFTIPSVSKRSTLWIGNFEKSSFCTYTKKEFYPREDIPIYQ